MPFSPPESVVLHQMERIFAVPPFSSSALLRRFLHFVILETLAGRGKDVTQYSIGHHVFDLGPDFNPESNAVVRVNANRLRRALEKYYSTAGKAEYIVISMPAGGYSLSITYGSKIAYKTSRSLPAPVLALVEFEGGGLKKPWKQFPLLLIEELSVSLGRLSQLRLMGPFRRAVLLARNQKPEELGKSYTLDFILDGRVEQIDEELIVHTRLLEGGTGLEIWSRVDRFPLANPDIADLESTLMRQLSMEVFEEFGAMDQHMSTLAKVKPENSLTVFESVLSGRMYYERFDEESLHRGRASLRRAIALVPDEALPRATLATLLAGACFQPFWRDEAPLEEVAEHANRAYALDPGNRWSIIARGASAVIHHQRKELAQIGSRVEAAPDAGKLLQGATGVWLIYQNVETSLGLRLISQACEENPHHPPSFHLGACLAALKVGDWDTVLKKVNDFGLSGDWRDPLFRGAIAANRGDLAAARGHWQRLLTLYPDFATRGFHHTRRLWHEDYVRILCESLNRAGAGIAM
jgi:TolB-like protein